MTAEAAFVASLLAWATPRCEAVRAEVRWLGLDATRIEAPRDITWAGDPCAARPSLTVAWTDPRGAHQLAVHPQLALWVTGPIAAGPAKRGEPVTVAHGEIALHALTGHLVPGAGPYVARTGLVAGAPLTDLVVDAPPDARAGTVLPLRVERGAVVVSADVRLLTDAHVGERVRFVNLVTQLGGEGVLVAPDRVELR